MTIAIDGYSSCGKSTIARDLAEALGFIYVDSGAMYRAFTLFLLNNKIDYNDVNAVERALDQVDIDFQTMDNELHTFLNGQDVEKPIRSLRVSGHVSPVAAIPIVRRSMVARQRQLAGERDIVMDGRDIGTVVFPDAELKLFVTASLEERVRRRLLQLESSGIIVSEEEVRKSITTRDAIDTTREDSPLTRADDAVEMDTTDLTREGQLQIALDEAKKRMA